MTTIAQNFAVKEIILKYYAGKITYKEYQLAILEVWKDIGNAKL